MSFDSHLFEPWLEALRRNGMPAMAAANREEALRLSLSLIPAGASVAVGGSVTLDEIGFLTALRSGGYHFLDRYQAGLTAAALDALFLQTLSAGVFFLSTSAITRRGELVNKDGRGNRLAPLIFGPGRVVVVAGRNKLVDDVAAGLHRIETVAAPRNSVRLKLDNPCVKTGRCMNCASPRRICCHTVITGFQRIRDRIHVILVDEELGY